LAFRMASERYAATHNLTLDVSLELQDLGFSAWTSRNAGKGASTLGLCTVSYTCVGAPTAPMERLTLPRRPTLLEIAVWPQEVRDGRLREHSRR